MGKVLEDESGRIFAKSSANNETALNLTAQNHKELFSIASASKATVTWLKHNVGHYISPGGWSPNSPDLSPIENFW